MSIAQMIAAHPDVAGNLNEPLALARDLLRAKGAHAWVVGLSATEQTDTTLAYLRTRLPADRFELRSWFELSDFYRKSVVLLSRQLDVRRECPAQFHECPHDLHIDSDGAGATQNAGQHGDTLLGKGIGKGAPAAAAII